MRRFPLKTFAVAQGLGVTYHRIMGLIRYGKIRPPRKDSSGDYVWTAHDLEAARKALGSKPFREEVTTR